MRIVTKRNGYKSHGGNTRIDLGVNIEDPYLVKSTPHSVQEQIQYGDLAPKFTEQEEEQEEGGQK